MGSKQSARLQKWNLNQNNEIIFKKDHLWLPLE